jgi:hypothetical protein
MRTPQITAPAQFSGKLRYATLYLILVGADQNVAPLPVWNDTPHKTELEDAVEVPIVLGFDNADFEDYWSSWSTGPTRIAQRLQALPSKLCTEIERQVRAGYLAGMPDGLRSFAIIVRAVRGTVPPAP